MKANVIVRDRQLRQRALDRVLEIPLDSPHVVEIKPYVEDKTAEQRNFFHKLCDLAAKEYHTQPWKVKEAVKQELWGYDVVSIGGKQRVVTKSSESASRKEYSDLIEELYRMAAMDGVKLPPSMREDAA